MLNYTAKIFAVNGETSFSPNASGIIVAFIQLLGSYIATLMIERAGRRVCVLYNSTLICKDYFCLYMTSYSCKI